MDSKIKVLGHPVHQTLIVLPLGLFAAAVVFDVVHAFGDDATMAVVAYWMITAGIVGGLLAAPFGTIDWLAIPKGTRAKRIGALHGVGNVIVIGLFAVNWLMRYEAPADPGALPIVLSGLAVALALFTAWLGGELVDRLAVGVYAGAHLNAPSSLSGLPASERTHTAPASH